MDNFYIFERDSVSAVLNGNAGNDTLHGSAGADTLYGGAGDGSYFFNVGMAITSTTTTKARTPSFSTLGSPNDQDFLAIR